tara:strand:- start:1276 stop:2673 length:1398 start_codon:yes stop_codon:yes gene_type:complete
MDSDRKRLYRNESYIPPIINNKRKTPKTNKTPIDVYFERIKKVFDSSTPNETFIHKEELIKKLQDEKIYTGKSVFDFLDGLKHEKDPNLQNSNYDLNQDRQRKHDIERELRQEFEMYKQEENTSQKKGIEIHQLGRAISLVEPEPFLNMIDLLPPTQESIKLKSFLTNTENLSEADFSESKRLWETVGRTALETIPAFYHPLFEGIVLNITLIKKEYDDIKYDYNNSLKSSSFPLSLFDYIEYILLHELFHIIVRKRAEEHFSFEKYVNYVCDGVVDYDGLTTDQYKYYSNLLICKVLSDLKLRLTSDLGANNPPPSLPLTKSGYYYPLEEALANLFAYKNHSMENKNTVPFEWITNNLPQGVGYDDWMKFMPKDIDHAVEVELGWMIKGKTFEDGVNAVHDSVIHGNHSKIRELMKTKHSRTASIFKSARTTIQTIQKNTPIHLIIDDVLHEPININKLKKLFN